MATQNEISKHLGLSLKGTRNMLSKLELDNKTLSMEQIRIAYIANLDSVSANRSGHLDIANERLKLMSAQRRKIRLETKIVRMDLKNDGAQPMQSDQQEEKITMSEFTRQTSQQGMQLISIMRKHSGKSCYNKECPMYEPIR